MNIQCSVSLLHFFVLYCTLMSDYLCDCKKTVSIKAILRKEGRVLMVKNTHGVYDLPGGRMRCGESIKQTLLREIKEEIGKDVTSVAENPLFVFDWEYKEGNSHGIVIGYSAEIEDLYFKSEDADIVAFEWVEPKTINELHMPQAWKEAYIKNL